MSRPAPSKPTATPTSTKLTAPDEICPICKSTRYLTPHLRFLVNPECYHKLCSSCVDRIFSHGPAQCPLPGCHRTLRKHRFREPTFEDIRVEREVDVRRRVRAVFNRREDEFEEPRAWNDYLNDVEDITFNLVSGIDLVATEKRFEAYRLAHEREILENTALEAEEKQSFTAGQKAERQQARLRREAARREEEEEKAELEAGRKDVLRRMAAGEDAEAVAQSGGVKVQLKKRMDRRAAEERQRVLQATGTEMGSSDVVIKGLKARQRAREPEAPLDPFGGMRVQRQYTVQQTGGYEWEVSRETRKDVRAMAGGFDLGIFEGRALCEAFAGLGVFLAGEVMEREKMGQDERVVSTVRAEIGVEDVKMGEVF